MNESTHGRRDTAKAQGKMASKEKPFLDLAIAMDQRNAMYLVSSAFNITE